MGQTLLITCNYCGTCTKCKFLKRHPHLVSRTTTEPTPPPAPRQVSPTASRHRISLLPRCPHEGAVLEFCPQGNEALHVRDCDLHDKCTRGKNRTQVHVCLTCEDHPMNAVRRPALPPAPIHWAVGVTSVPERRTTLLPPTLLSIARAGFPQPTLFVDGVGHADALSWEKEFGLTVVSRWPRIRTYGNWVLALGELFIRNPTFHRFCLIQDDVELYANLRHYLDRQNLGERTYWNLYTVPRNERQCVTDKQPRTGFHDAVGAGDPSKPSGWGALALVFSRQGVIDLLTNQHAIERPLDLKRGHRAIDGGIVTALAKAGYRERVHYPTLVQHTGAEDSAMGSKQAPTPTTFRGGSYDAMELLAGT